MSYKLLFARASLGNVGVERAIAAGQADVPNTANLATYVPILCPAGKTMTDLVAFGLALKDETVTGNAQDGNVDVKTVSRCSLGGMSDVQNEWNLDQLFETYCSGKSRCTLPIDFTKVFDNECRYQLRLRLKGRSDYGPPRVYALAACTDEVLEPFNISRADAAMLIVAIDLVIIVIFVIALWRLKYLETLTVEDLRNGQLRIEDFSVLLRDIPIDPEDYNSNPELLTAMLVTHLEDVVRNEVQVIEDLEAIQDHESEIVSVHYGLSSQQCMRHLVAIYEDVK